MSSATELFVADIVGVILADFLFFNFWDGSFCVGVSIDVGGQFHWSLLDSLTRIGDKGSLFFPSLSSEKRIHNK